MSFVTASAGYRILANVINAGATAATIALAVRLLGTQSYGRLALGLAAVTLVTTLGRLGLGLATVRIVTGAANDPERLSRATRGTMTLVTVASLVSAGVIVPLMVFGPLGLERETRLILAAGLVVMLVGDNYALGVAAIARGLGRIAVAEALIILITLGQLATMVVLYVVHLPDLRAVALGFGASGALAALVSAGSLVRLLPDVPSPLRFALGAARTTLRIMVPFAAAAAASAIITQLDVFVLGMFHSKSEVGTYQPTLRLTDGLMQLVPFVLAAGFVPAATRLFMRGDRNGFRDLYLESTKLGYVLAFPAVLLLGVFPEPVLHALFGAGFSVRPVLVWVLLIGYVVNLAVGTNVAALVSSGDRKRLIWANITGFGTMIVVALGLIPPFGAVGAALATMASYLTWNAAASVALWRSSGLLPSRRDNVVTVATSLAILTLGLLTRPLSDGAGLWLAIGWTLMLWLLWIGVLTLAKALRWRELASLVFHGGARRREFLSRGVDPAG
jgi:O-antigen/teichoic acid export membrane protein